MSYRRYLIIISTTAVIGWISFILVLNNLDPCKGPGITTLCYTTSALSITLFFLSSFFAFTATFTLLGFLMRFWLHRHEIYLDHLNVSLRQGLLLTFSTLGALGLLLLNALTWWSGLLFIVIIILLELYFTRGE